MARKRGITRSRSFTAGARAYANSAANVSKSKVWITCPASHRISSATPVQARMANGRPTRRIHVAITTTELTSRVARGRVFEDIHLLLCHGYCCVFHDRSCSHVGTQRGVFTLRVILPRINLTCQVFREECFDSAMSDFYTDLIVRSRGTNLVHLLLTIRSVRLAHTAGHLQLDRAFQLHPVLHRQL